MSLYAITKHISPGGYNADFANLCKEILYGKFSA